MSWSRSNSRLVAAAAAVIAADVALAAPASANAQGAADCAGLDWPLEWEQTAFAAAKLASVASGASLKSAAAEAFVLELLPENSAKLAAAPSGKSKAAGPDLYAGFVTVEGGAGPVGVQVTTSEEGWIDVIQDGKTLPSTAHTGSKNCPGVRKSVHFDVTAGSFAVQVVGVPRHSVKVSVRRTD